MKKWVYLIGIVAMLLLTPWLLMAFAKYLIPAIVCILVLAIVVDRIDRKPQAHHFRYYENADRFKGALSHVPYRPSRTRITITLQEIPPFEMDVLPQKPETVEVETDAPSEESQPTPPADGEPIVMRPHRPSVYVYCQEGEDTVYFTTKKEVTRNPFFRVEETSDDQI